MSTKFLSPGWRMPRNANQSKQSNYSIDFDDASGGDYITFNSPSSLWTSGGLSVSFWIKTTTTENDSIITMDDHNAGNRNWQIEHRSSGNVVRLYVFGSTSAFLNTSVSINDGNWHHLVFTYEPSTALKVYIDGSLDNSNTTSIPASRNTNSANLRIATNDFGSKYTGSLSDVSIFDYAVSESQVTTLYGDSTNGVGNPMALPSPPIAYYPLGTSAWDGSFLAENNAIGDYVFDFIDGNNTFVDCGANENILDFSGNDYTVSAWVKWDGTGDANQMIASVKSSGSNVDFALTIEQNDGKISYWNGSSYVQSNSAIPTGVWCMVSVIVKATQKDFFINGVADGTPSQARQATAAAGTNFLIGKSNFGNEYFNGKISNLQVFNAVLSSTELETLYNYGSPIQTLASIPQNSNLKSWHKLDASEVYNSSTTEWSIDNNQNPSAYASSLDFNGTNDYIDCGNPSIFTDLTSFSFSCWFNSNVKGNDDGILGKWLSGTNRSFALNLETSGAGSAIRFAVFNSSGAVVQSYINSSDWSTGSWYNVSGTYDGTNVKLYLDGVLKDTVALTGTVRNASQSFRIGVYGSSSYFDGEISNVQIFNTALTTTNVASLYNNGTPLSDMSSFTSLVSWYKLNNTTTGIEDAKGSNNGTNNGATEYPGFVNTLVGDSSAMTQANLVQSDLQTVAPYSKYAMNFDGINDKFNLNSTVNLSNSWSVGFWFKTPATTSNNMTVFRGNATNNEGDWSFFRYFGVHYNKSARFSTKLTSGGTSSWAALTPDILDNLWHNLVITYNYSTSEYKVYLDGNVSFSGIYNTSTGNTFTIIGSNEANWCWLGQLSNVSVWNAALTSSQATEIYNEGLPSNLNNHSAYSNLVSWWQLGENSSFATNWICADEKGVNNGESNGMGVDALTNGVGTTANGVSTGMSEGNLVGDAPYSTANAISSGISVVSRGTDVAPSPPSLLLDTYTGSQAAYSLRRLSNSYTGNLIRVTKKVSSVISTTDIGYNSSNELDTTALATFASGADNGEVRVDIWYDQSGNSNNASNSTFTSCPYIYQSGSLITENSKPAIKNGGNIALETTNSPFNSQVLSSFMVNKYYTTANYHVLLTIGNSNATSFRFFNVNNYGNWRANGLNLNGTSGDLDIQNLSSAYNTTTNLYARYNGSQFGTASGTAGAFTSSEIRIGKNLANANQNFNGTYQEFIFYSSEQSSNMSGIETNINNYYTIY